MILGMLNTSQVSLLSETDHKWNAAQDVQYASGSIPCNCLPCLVNYFALNVCGFEVEARSQARFSARVGV